MSDEVQQARIRAFLAGCAPSDWPRVRSELIRIEGVVAYAQRVSDVSIDELKAVVKTQCKVVQDFPREFFGRGTSLAVELEGVVLDKYAIRPKRGSEDDVRCVVLIREGLAECFEQTYHVFDEREQECVGRQLPAWTTRKEHDWLYAKYGVEALRRLEQGK